MDLRPLGKFCRSGGVAGEARFLVFDDMAEATAFEPPRPRRAGERPDRRGLAGRRPRLRRRRLGRGRRRPRCGARRRQLLALHLNYGLRPDSDRDQKTCEELCERLGIELEVERPELGEGNVQAEARRARYGAAERLRLSRGLDWIATGHTRTDLAETVLYRLATSPGRRALLGLRARRGTSFARSSRWTGPRPGGWSSRRGSPSRDDPTNAEPLYRAQPDPQRGAPRASRDRPTGGSDDRGDPRRARRGGGDARPARRRGTRRIRRRAPPVRSAGMPSQRWTRRSAGWCCAGWPSGAAGGQVPLGRRVRRRSGGSPTRRRAAWSSWAGEWRPTPSTAMSASRPARAEPAEATLTVPGVCRFGTWEVRAEFAAGVPAGRGPGPRRARPAALGGSVTVRAWREGDRMRPLGLGGPSRSRTCSPTARCPGRCGTPCRSSQ